MIKQNGVKSSVIHAEIAAHLGYDPSHPPITISDKVAADVLGVKSATLALWRSTGRYNLPYIKVGRLIKYRISDIADFMARRTTSHTGDVQQ